MIKAAICDDERAMAVQLNRLLEQAAQTEHVNLKTEIFYNGQELADSRRKQIQDALLKR